MKAYVTVLRCQNKLSAGLGCPFLQTHGLYSSRLSLTTRSFFEVVFFLEIFIEIIVEIVFVEVVFEFISAGGEN